MYLRSQLTQELADGPRVILRLQLVHVGVTVEEAADSAAESALPQRCVHRPSLQMSEGLRGAKTHMHVAREEGDPELALGRERLTLLDEPVALLLRGVRQH